MRTEVSNLPHGHLKNRIEQAVLLRGSTDFKSVGAYQHWVEEIVATINRGLQSKLDGERPGLQTLPLNKAIDYNETVARVTSQSTIQVALTTYSVPSRLIGERLKVHLYDDRIIVWLGNEQVFTSPRIRGIEGKRRVRRIDYRHMIGSLKKKPMAFYRSQYRDELFPNDNYRTIWKYLDERLEPRPACKLMVGCLALANEYDCEDALCNFLLESMRICQVPELLDLQRRFGKSLPQQSAQHISQHPLGGYDALINKSAQGENHATY